MNRNPIITSVYINSKTGSIEFTYNFERKFKWSCLGYFLSKAVKGAGRKGWAKNSSRAYAEYGLTGPGEINRNPQREWYNVFKDHGWRKNSGLLIERIKKSKIMPLAKYFENSAEIKELEMKIPDATDSDIINTIFAFSELKAKQALQKFLLQNGSSIPVVGYNKAKNQTHSDYIKELLEIAYNQGKLAGLEIAQNFIKETAKEIKSQGGI